jgi:hypothetical protein
VSSALRRLLARVLALNLRYALRLTVPLVVIRPLFLPSNAYVA